MQESTPGWGSSVSKEPGGKQVGAPTEASWLVQEQLPCWERHE